MDQELKRDEQLLNEIEVYCEADAAADLEEFYRREIRRLRQSLNAAELKYTVRLCQFCSRFSLLFQSISKKEKRTPSAGILEDLLSAIEETDLDLINRISKGSWNLNVLSKVKFVHCDGCWILFK